MKVMYLDESGDHSLRNINPRYPVFVLGGVIVDRAYVRTVIEPAMQAFKLKHFGRRDAILHTVEMGKGRGTYGFLADPDLRAGFYADLNAMLEALDYKVVACVIDRPAHVARSGAEATDPYHDSLDVLVERFCLELEAELDAGFICAEKRNPGLDRDLMTAWERLRTEGTSTRSALEIDERIVDLSLKDKKANLAGMQLAVLVITPIGRWVVGKAPSPNEVRWPVVERKLRRDANGEYREAGLVTRP